MAQDDPQESNNQQLMDALILLRLRLERVIQDIAPNLASMMDRTYRLVINRIEATPVLDSTAQARLMTLAETSVDSNLENVMRELRGQMQVMADASAVGTSAAIEDIMNREVSPDIRPEEAIGVEVLGVGLLAAMNRWRQSFLEMIQETMGQAAAAGGEGNDGQLAADQLRSDPGPMTGTDSDLQTEIVTLLGASTVVGQTNVVRRDQAAIAYWIRLAVLDSKTSLKTTTYVEMADGSRKMLADINVGERVITKSGKPKPVKSKTSYLTNKLVRLTLSDGQTIECTPDHLLWTADGWRQAIDFKKGDELK